MNESPVKSSNLLESQRTFQDSLERLHQRCNQLESASESVDSIRRKMYLQDNANQNESPSNVSAPNGSLVDEFDSISYRIEELISKIENSSHQVLILL